MVDTQTTAEELKVFQDFYRRRVAEAASGTVLDDGQELEIARDILLAVINDGLTPEADGGASYVRRGAIDWTDPATLQAARATTGQGARTRTTGRGRQSDLLQGVLIIGLALLAAVWFLWPAGDDEAEAVELTDAHRLALDETEVTPTPLPTLESDLLADIVEASGVKTELVVPRTLELKGVSFVVQPVQIRAGDWPLPDDERAVSWVYGTVINYVLGVEATPDNKALLASLQAGDELLLRMSTGPAYRFAFAEAVRVSPQASEVFRQTRPGLTLALLGDSAQAARVVIRAPYVPESELGLAVQEAAEPAAIGQPNRLDQGLRLTCLESDLLAVPSPPGYRYVRVNYRLENMDTKPLQTNGFNHHVKAGELIYGVVSTAAAWQTYPVLPERLPAGQVLTTTAVYALPETALAQTPLRWEFAATPAGTRLSVALPRLDTPPAPAVTLKEASRHENNTLLLAFEIRAALTEVVVTKADIRIEGGTLSPVGNILPWHIAPGEVGRQTLLLSPDGRGRLTVALLAQGFEITY